MGGVLGALFLGWALGANDAANLYGPAVSARALRQRTAVAVAMVFVVLGAATARGRTLTSIGARAAQTPASAIAVTVAAALAMTLLLVCRLPASSSQAVVGAIVGSAWARQASVDPVTLSRLLQGWVMTPLVACLLGLLGALLVGWVARARTHRGLLGLDPALRIAMLAVCAWGAFALGANNAANVSGVVVASGMLQPGQGAWLAGVSIALGIATFGGRLLYLVGRGLVRLEPATALVAMLAQASTVHLFAVWGVPVSTSQALAGGALGIGIAKGVRTIGRGALLNILLGWVATPLVGGLLAYVLAQVFTPR